MGVSNSPEIFQDKMNKVFKVLTFMCGYIDDLSVLVDGNWADHLTNLERVITKLKENVLKFNIEKSFSTKPKWNT